MAVMRELIETVAVAVREQVEVTAVWYWAKVVCHSVMAAE